VSESSADSNRFQALVLPKANHKVVDSDAQTELVGHVVAFLHTVLGDSRQDQEEIDTPSTFDQVVELITSGKADSIAGVKQIPLKVGCKGSPGRGKPSLRADCSYDETSDKRSKTQYVADAEADKAMGERF
jgi:hypothetical protein